MFEQKWSSQFGRRHLSVSCGGGVCVHSFKEWRRTVLTVSVRAAAQFKTFRPKYSPCVVTHAF